MTNKQDCFDDQSKTLLKRIEMALENHEKGISEDLSPHLLRKIKEEVDLMANYKDPEIYIPSYPKSVLDWPDVHGLVERLVDFAYRYMQLK